eukprot:gene16997-22496_t
MSSLFPKVSSLDQVSKLLDEAESLDVKSSKYELHSDYTQCIDENIRESKVKFNSSLRVILIPSRIDYRSADLIPSLWWSINDYRNFQQSAYSEIRLFSVSEGIPMDEARKMLYQPHGNYYGSSESTSDKDLFEEAVISRCSRTSKQNDYSSNMRRQDSLSHLDSSNRDRRVQSPNHDNNTNREKSPSFESLSLCVPLTDMFPLVYHTRQSRRSGKRQGLFNMGLGLVSAVAIAVVIIPNLFNFERLFSTNAVLFEFAA